MAVRFLPPPEAPGEPGASGGGERENLAEVIELRSRLPRVDTRAPAAQPVAPEAANHPAYAGRERAARARAAAREAEVASDEEAASSTGPERTAHEDGVRLLARRARSSGELRRELAQLGHDTNEVELVALEFEGSLYLDDLGLARTLTESLRERKRASRAQIRLKLRERLLPDGVIEEVLGELDDEEEDELLRAAAEDRARRLTSLDRQTAERRLLGFLARRGWSGERATRAARAALDAAGNAGGGSTVRFR